MNGRVLALYKQVMSVPEGLPHGEYRRLMRKHIRGMTQSEVAVILAREEEIEASSMEEWDLRRQIFLVFGFMSAEASFLARCRLDSPGIRALIKERVAVTRYGTSDEVKRINEGDRGTLRALRRLYGKEQG